MKKILRINILILLFVLIFFTTFSFSFTEEEQVEINDVVNTLVANSKNNGVTWQIDITASNTKVAFFQTNFVYEGVECKYLVTMYWNNQFNFNFTNNTITAKHNTGERNEICSYYFDKDLNLIGAKTVTYGYSDSSSFIVSNVISCFHSTFTLKDSSGNVVQLSYTPLFVKPFFITTKEELETGTFDYLKINSGDFTEFTEYGKEFYLLCYYYSGDSNDIESLYPRKEILLNGKDSKYYYSWNSNWTYTYFVPFGDLGLDFKEGNEYAFRLVVKDSDGVITKRFDYIRFTIGVISDLDKELNSDQITQGKLDEQTEAIKENTETNKGILSSIGNLISYINPFSENFFVYKLIELLGDLLKSLFVPGEDFMSEWFTDISSYFEEAFGILYFPIDLVIQVLGRFNGITGQEPVITFGNLELFGAVLIPSFTYNFNDILTTPAFKTVHDFYLITIDVILWLGLLVYCKNVCANIFGGKFTDDVVVDVTDYSDNKKIEEENKRKSNYIGFRP